MKRMGLFLTMLLAASAAFADGTADLRAALAKFPGHETLRASVTIESMNSSDDDEKPKLGRGTVDVEKGSEGVRVFYTPETIGRAQQEARAEEIDPEKPTPTVRALRELDAITLMEALDGASLISRYLDNAKLQKDVRLPNGGKATRQLTFTVEPGISKADAKRIKSAAVTLVVNLDADSIPVAMEMQTAVKAKFLLMTFEQKGQESWTFGRAGDNLLALRHHERHSGSGMGQKFSGTTTTTVVVR